MKIITRPYPRALANYYGKKVARTTPSVVIAKSFDNGWSMLRGLTISKGMSGVVPSTHQHSFTEYEVNKALSTDFTEYDVWANKYEEAIPVLEQQQSLAIDENVFMESFASTENPSDPPNDTCNCRTEKEKKTPDQKIRESIENQVKQKVEEASEAIDRGMPKEKENEKVNSTLSALPESLKDDDLFADIQSILKGESHYDQADKTLKKRTEERNAPELFDHLPKENEHKIFDSIAKSMEFSNSYDLGSLSLEKTLEDFDHLEDIKGKPKLAESQNLKSDPKVSSEDFLEDYEWISQQSATPTAQSTPPPIVLDPGVGGRSIMHSVLEPGDIILSTTTAEASAIIRKVTGAEISHAAVYVGNGNVIEAIDDGVILRSLETALEDDSVAVAFRHTDMTPEKGQKMVDFLMRMAREKRKFDFKGLIKVAPYVIAKQYCDKQAGEDKEKCLAAASKMKLGTDNNNEFYCSELVLEALQTAGLNITDTEPAWSSPNDIVKLNHNGKMEYIGHLKTP